MDHATWKYGWKATTTYGAKLIGAVVFPVGLEIKIDHERDITINRPDEIAKYIAKQNAESQLIDDIKFGNTVENDTIMELNIWAMADNRLR